MDVKIEGYKDMHEWETGGFRSRVYLMDCMDFLAQVPDKAFDLAVVDPPYGIGEDGKSNHSRGCLAKSKQFTPKSWDSEPPPKEYFDRLMRCSKNQIAWGANHYISRLPFDSSCWIVWDKDNGATDFADCELAWTSFKSAVRRLRFKWQGMLQGNMKNKENRIHPTQKPVALYSWIYHNYISTGGSVLDTHLGSASSRIAAHKAGNIEFIGIEIDEDYFYDGVKRFEQYARQLALF
jgi:site-specific DNA-methyltransferase (adenine-specific)